jgi:hypothetical protein
MSRGQRVSLKGVSRCMVQRLLHITRSSTRSCLELEQAQPARVALRRDAGRPPGLALDDRRVPRPSSPLRMLVADAGARIDPGADAQLAAA